MFGREEKRRAMLIVLNGFMERHAAEIETGMTDERLKEAIAARMAMRLVWGGPGRFSGSCNPEQLQIFAGPTPLEIAERPIVAAEGLLKLVREEYGIPDPSAAQRSAA